jgi:hypothetical protein
MVYAGKIGDDKVSLGVSGRLQDDNLVMWDSQTNSLWNQITGTAVYGESKGKSLDLMPAVFVGLSTWTKMHPDTVVLDLPTVQQKSWYYTTDELRAGGVEGRGGVSELGVGLRHDGDTLAISMARLQEARLVQVEVGGVPLAVVWVDAGSVPLVYDRRRGGETLELSFEDGALRGGGSAFDALTGKAGDDAAPLQRFPYLPTYLEAWKTYYPTGR